MIRELGQDVIFSDWTRQSTCVSAHSGVTTFEISPLTEGRDPTQKAASGDVPLRETSTWSSPTRSPR